MSSTDSQLLIAVKAIERHLGTLAARTTSYHTERLMDVGNEVMANHTSQFSALCAALRGAIAATTPSGSVTTSVTGTSWVQLASAPADFFRGDNHTGTTLLFRKVGTDVMQQFAAGTHILIDCDANADEWEIKRNDEGTDQVTFDYLLYESTSSMGNMDAVITAMEAVEDAILLSYGSLEAIKTSIQSLLSQPAIGDGSVTTAVDGTSYTTLTSGSATQIKGDNVTGADLSFRRTGGSAVFVVPDGATVDLPCTANANEWEVKRTDESTSQVTFGYIRRYTV